MFGMCGDNCSYCPRLIATKSGRTIELEKVSDLWVRLGLREPDFPVKDMACHGCKPGKKCAYTELRACVSRQGYENCGPCEQYPCNLINSVFQKTEILKSHAGKVCNQKEMNRLHKAFFSKKEYFDRMHREHRKKIKT
jgi:Protein of unknown function (DUF3795)